MRFELRIIDESTGEVLTADHCTIGTIDQFGGCESVDHSVAAALRYARKLESEQQERAR